jgi:hypothetical protein
MLRIPEVAGSGAARLFDLSLRATEQGRAVSGRAGLTAVVWFGFAEAWTCIACFNPLPVRAFDQEFLSQIDFSGGPDHQEWSESVIAHEFGHWHMESYGVSPGEGGPHTINTPLTPGLAWAEGYATWYGATVRESPVFVDKQRGTMFWFDIAARDLGTVVWSRTDPTAGLLQPIAENEVAAILWALAPTGSRAPLFNAVSSRRMTVAPFARGYLSTPARRSTPVLPDFLDALVCGGVATARVNAATLPTYPYPSDAPLCAPSPAAEAPVTGAWRVRSGPSTAADGSAEVSLTATLDLRGALDAPLRAWVQLPAGTRLLAGTSSWTVAQGAHDEHSVTLRAAPGGALGATLVFDAQGRAMGAHGAVPWSVEAPTPEAVFSGANGPPLVVAGHVLGPSVPMVFNPQ